MHLFTEHSVLKPFPAGKLQNLLADLEKYRPSGRAIAAFDADGTLWNTDLGEAFFNYQIQNKLVPLPDDPWGHYNHLKDHVSHTEAYVWLAQVLNGQTLEQVRRWAEQSVASQPLPVFEEQRQILKKLRELEVEVWIVTASIKWAVEPGARRLGLREDQVIGIETAVVDGRIGLETKGIVTYREGKAQALLAQTDGVAPYFCAGNSEGDLYLLEAATQLRLVLSSAPEGTENFGSEAKMLALAEKKGWYSHRY